MFVIKDWNAISLD